MTFSPSKLLRPRSDEMGAEGGRGRDGTSRIWRSVDPRALLAVSSFRGVAVRPVFSEAFGISATTSSIWASTTASWSKPGRKGGRGAQVGRAAVGRAVCLDVCVALAERQSRNSEVEVRACLWMKLSYSSSFFFLIAQESSKYHDNSWGRPFVSC